MYPDNWKKLVEELRRSGIRMQEARQNNQLRIARKRLAGTNITTEYAPRLGPGTDVNPR